MRGRRRYEVKQHDDRDCAAACLCSVCSWFGKHLPLIELRDMCGTTDGGANMQGVVDAAGRLGLSASPMKACGKNWELLSSIDTPAIVHFSRPGGRLHFVVMYRWSPGYAVIMDPAEGRTLRMAGADFMSLWTGYLVILSPAPEFRKEDRKTDRTGRYLDILRSSRSSLLHAMVGSTVYVLTGLATSVFIQRILDVAIPGRDMKMLTVFALSMALMAVSSFVVGYGRTMFTVRAGLDTDFRLVNEYLKKLLSLPALFFSTRSAGELNSRIRDVYRIRNFLTVRLMVIIICVMTMIGAFVLMFTLCSRMAAVVLVYVPLYVLLYKMSDSITRKKNRKTIESAADFDSESIDVLAGIQTIRYLGWQDVFMDRLRRKYTVFLNDSWSSGKYIAGFPTAAEAAARLLTYSVLCAGGILVFKGVLTVGELVSFYTVTSFFTSPLNSLIESNNDITQASVAADRLFEILDLQPEKDEGGSLIPECGSGEICVSGLSFSYPGGPLLFDDVSFSFPSGTFTAVTGGNGSGKSTLAMLLMRGCEPSSGSITLDGKDIRGFNLRSWRNYITMVPQKAELFRGSILENIAPGESAPDAEKIASLCVMASLEESIARFPEGLAADVGAGGCRLSGGERQKVALVRAMYKDARVLLLDEAAASVDAKGKERILSSLKQLAARGRTIIMITHDEFFLTAADRVIVVGQQSINNHQS